MGGSPELRALALARLAPRPGVLVWDVAAGCGAVGVEAARLGAAVIAVENDPGLCVRIVANAKRHGVDVRLVDGPVPEALAGLPKPDAVFLGTARTDVVRSCAGLGAARIVVEVHELGSVGPARDALVDAGYVVDGRLVFAAPIHGLASGAAAVEQASSNLLLWGTLR
jgi:precorrin-6Y C5,15-methyltransferase (decarboxylating)